MARDWFKNWWMRFVFAPIERSTYVLVASILLFIAFFAWRPIPNIIWETHSPFWRSLLEISYWGGWALAISATFPINHWDLFGVRQVYLFLEGIPYTPPPTYDSILYRLLPHPIFIGYALVVWSTPRMTIGHAVSATILSVFLLVDVWLAKNS
jgi:hypothetical protein